MKSKMLPAITEAVIIIFISFLSSICHSQNTIPGYQFPLKKNLQGDRYLRDQNDQPFFWLGDAAWSLIAQCSREDVDLYLNDRRNKGFSVILVSLIEHKFCSNAPANFYGEKPFTSGPFSVPNDKYFEHADYVIRSAAIRNILVLLAPLYLGYDCKDEGWCAETQSASLVDMLSWGRYVGNRYKDFGNILWIIGGDTDPARVKDKVLEMIRGIREKDTAHLFSAHNQPESMAADPWTGEDWLNVNDVYSYDSTLYTHFKTAFERKPVMPFYLCESAYENEHMSNPRQLRLQAYQAILSGAMGHIFGNCPIWHFGAYKKWCGIDDWKTELNNWGSKSMEYFQRLFRSRPWQTLVPDFSQSLIISGSGTWGHKDYVTAAITSDGGTMISYIPSGHSVSVDMGRISGKQARCWWYDPARGKASHIGTIQTSGRHIFAPVSDEDWVLVIDNASLNYPPPGAAF